MEILGAYVRPIVGYEPCVVCDDRLDQHDEDGCGAAGCLCGAFVPYLDEEETCLS